jgi:hypothetical protein
VAVRLVAPGMLLRDGGVVDMWGLGAGLWYGVTDGMLYWEAWLGGAGDGSWRPGAAGAGLRRGEKRQGEET